ncbi:TIGR00180 family glycosyltransferase [Pseudomonas sp. NFR16]|uniref:TIGR00180 family glycosyltransferase n=1 Tax=Pseudomonas sp. NFR16 TaxID=1566248 RepID=UPI0008ABE0F5|nr:TIGR00180 family glycosyltransferase [Pseudomonas sp. NFR16]SEI82634.1 glycosyltransferase domain-containing protein [Pseudomonas sp. NFR16]
MNNVLPISRLSVLNDALTVMIVTQNRPAHLRRALQHYRTLPCKVLVLDFSQAPAAFVDEASALTHYLHLPQYAANARTAGVAHGLAQVATPYMVLAEDGDFLVHQALADSVDFLQAQPDYGLCHGYSLMYEAAASSVEYLRRDRKVHEDYSAATGQQRIIDAFSQYIPPCNAVTRTALLRDWHGVLPEETNKRWQEIGQAFYLLARAKARILDVPYIVREFDSRKAGLEPGIFDALTQQDARSGQEREAFANFLADQLSAIEDTHALRARLFIRESFAALVDSLRSGNALSVARLLKSVWTEPSAGPERLFEPRQYVEMPFYNQAFFDQLTRIEFLIHGLPAGTLQLEELEGVWVRQEQLLQGHENDVPETVTNRLWAAMKLNPFNRVVVKSLTQKLVGQNEKTDALQMRNWTQRLEALPVYDERHTLDSMPSGRLLNWLAARSPDADQLQGIAAHLSAVGGGPQFGLLLLDLEDDMDKLQLTLDSLVEGHSKAFRAVVFTTGEPPATTTLNNTLHFVKVTQNNYVDKLNQIVRQLICDWVVLAEVGDVFTASGLLRAGLELQSAPPLKAICVDEIQRLENGALVDVFRPGFNLDLLQSLPALMARHWLVSREALVDVGGYSADYSDALELDLLLRIIEKNGTTELAHLDEVLLITDAPVLEENGHERMALIRHLGTRGYKALVTSAQPGTWQIDYRHSHRPQVSIIVDPTTDLQALQRCLNSVAQRTRYTAYELLVAAHGALPEGMLTWLKTQEQPGGRVRVLIDSAQSNGPALINRVSAQARGEYLVLLSGEAEVINPNWLGSLLNQALRPEVGVVGAKLVDAQGTVTQAGLVLNRETGIATPFKGEAKGATGYLHRLVLEQSYSAVSGACLMVRRALFEEVQGLDENTFGQGFADLDLCLKIGQTGHMIVWTAQVQIIHPGTLPEAPEALAALRAKWAARFEQDQAYNPNLSLSGQPFTLGDAHAVNWSQLIA